MRLISKLYLPTFVGLFCFLFGCTNSKSDVISTVYLHKYGTPLTESDWDSRGGNGQVVSVCKDGTTITENYVDHMLEGKTTTTFPHSKVIAKEENFRQGHLISETHHYTNGVPRLKKEFISDKALNLTKWFNNGNPMSVEKFINESLQEGEYYNTSNELESKVNAGEGLKVERNTQGDFLSQIQFKNGHKNLQTTFHPNGDPCEIIPFLNGQVHGLKKIFGLNGVPERFEEWEHGMQSGVTTLFRDGQKHIEQDYAFGQKNGLEVILDDLGRVACETEWRNDVKHGVCKTYINDTVRMVWFYKGKKVSHSEFEKLAVH